MKKVLLLAYHYPPYSGIAARRAVGVVTFLPFFGWEPIVVAGDWKKDNTRYYDSKTLTEPLKKAIIRTCPTGSKNEQHPILRQIKHRIIPLIQGERYPNKWFTNILSAGREIIEQEQPDVIWATFSPPASLKAADALSRTYHVPWIADFRDTWRLLSKRFFWRYELPEKQLCKSASSIITVSQGLADELSQRHQRPVVVIYNGFDPKLLNYLENSSSNNERQPNFTIVYTGNVLPGIHGQDPSPLFQALDYLLMDQKIDPVHISIHFIGSTEQSLRAIQRFRSYEFVTITPWLPREQALQAQRNASILLHLATPHIRGVLSGKIFEYLASGRPILSFPHDQGGVSELLAQTRAGVSLVSADEIAEQILLWYQEWQRSGTVRNNADIEIIKRYSKLEQARILASVLDEAAKQSRKGFIT